MHTEEYAMTSEEMEGEHMRSSSAMHDVKHAIAENFPDEIHDSNKYLTLAQTAAENGESTSARGFFEMAKEEYTHAKFLKYQAHIYGIELSHEDVMEFHDLEERLSAIFR